MADPAVSAPLGRLTAAFEQSGSPYWLMDAIQRRGLDRRHGFELRVNYGDDAWRDGRHATEAALAAGTVDFIDCDWLTLLRCRAEGLALSAVYPYGRILGGLVVPPSSAIADLDDLAGRKIGVVNRRDKNWMLLRAYGQRLLDRDLEAQAQVLEAGSKTTLVDWLQAGLLDAALVYWHQIPALLQQGYRLLLDIPLLLPALGAEPAPTTFFLFRDDLIRNRPELIRAFIAAFEDALAELHQPEAWSHIGSELLGIDDTELLGALRRCWQGRIAQPWQVPQIEALAPLTRTLGGFTDAQFRQAFAWDFIQPPATA